MEIAAGKFKATCLDLMNKVEETGEEIIITKHGKPICKLVPIENKITSPLFGCLREQIKIKGDIVGSISSDEDWASDLDNFVLSKVKSKSHGKKSVKRAS